MCSNAGNNTDNSNLIEKFSKRFISLSDEGMDFDCEFIVGIKKVVVRGHKFLFAASSKVFQAMFYGDLKEDKTVIVEDLNSDGFESMKQFIYTGEINFTSVIKALLTYVAARKYLISVLSEVCSNYIKENILPAEVLEFYECCKIVSVSEFEELCCKIIQEKTDEVITSEYFTLAKPESIELILKSSSLSLKSEFEVFDLFERWALAEASRNEIAVGSMATSFNHLKKHIRFLTIGGQQQCVSRVSESLLLTPHEKFAIGMNQMKVNARPVPASLSSQSQQRHFITSASPTESYTMQNTFMIKINSTCESCNRYDLFAFKNHFYISAFQSSNCVFFEIMPGSSTNYYTLIFFMKTKLRVMAVNSYDDLYIEKELDFKWNGNIKPENQKVTIAAIPINKLQKECFSRGTNAVVIEGSFKVQKIE
ncbi:uncharacterized protein LOC111051329 [Nilaparvata lugens]|uniref:uncharacterized protein LOC111051329 n=1 Tax=Nilaparvata lugens TaxID=108931 RepID=UPI000B9863D7|nr:uncharacterized protein LOC111051329 [Nilaparvata lugens]